MLLLLVVRFLLLLWAWFVSFVDLLMLFVCDVSGLIIVVWFCLMVVMVVL